MSSILMSAIHSGPFLHGPFLDTHNSRLAKQMIVNRDQSRFPSRFKDPQIALRSQMMGVLNWET